MVKNITLIRNILYKCFIIGYLFVVFTSLIYMYGKGWIINLTSGMFMVSEHEVNLAMVYIIGLMKMFNIFVFLIPALALHWTGHGMKNKTDNPAE